MDMRDGVAVGNSAGVQGSVVTAGTPTVVLLGHDMECGGPRTFGAASCAILQHGVEFGLGNSEPVRCEATWSAGDWWARCGPDVVDRVVAHFMLKTSGTCEGWELGEEGVDWSAATDDFHPGGP
jgi:hypothetical protein